MFLKRMEIKGFKSFAKPTTIEFTDGLIVVVGPNGSGKSNINDAFKWVLGEASKKTLRTKSGSDIIFSGSDLEKPADFAEVTLVFNNEDKILDIKYNDVSITRRIYREDKLSEYYINKTLVRRKDVRDLFLGTGLGNTDLSIISQGSVTKVAESKPEDLRSLLNEAAGISKYQTQKDESLRKLEKVQQNLEIFNVKLDEIKKQIGPLKKKKELAEKYFSIKEELSVIELPIIKRELEKNITRKDELSNLISDSENKKNLSSEKLLKIETKIKLLQEKIITLDNELYTLQTKQSELSSNSFVHEETKANLEKSIKNLIKSLKDSKHVNSELILSQDKSSGIVKKVKTQEFDLSIRNDKINQDINRVNYEIQNLKTKTNYNNATKSIIKNKNIFNNGVYGLFNEVISYNKKFDIAISTAIGNRLSNIIVEDEKTIQEAINFLKENNLGKSTFIPLDKVKPNSISKEYEMGIQTVEGYLGTISSIVRPKKPIFKKVIDFVGGEILVFENIENALKAAKLIGYKYDIVTLEGDQIFSGFTVKGGSVTADSKLNTLEETLKVLKSDQTFVSESLAKKQEELNQAKDDVLFSQNESIRLQERIVYLETNLQRMLEQFKSKTGKEFDLKKFEKSQDYISSDLSIEQINSKIKRVQIEKQKIQKDIINKQEEEHELREIWEKSISTNTESSIELNNLDALITRDFEILNKDYKMTYENLASKKIRELKIDYRKAEKLREKYRNEIKDLGYIDFESIETYEELFTTHNELNDSVNDLTESRKKLLSTIEVMDKQMKEQFSTTFENVNEKFQSTFSTLFRGGEATMLYTDPESILTTGIEIRAKVPGKTVKSISLYSGGEKSLISLSLIFAINEVKNLPILMLDEVEAALDESNVDRFAKFSKTLNEKTQVIITTHRPGTMEQADILYGVTMQQKGVTDIVSVKLEKAIKMIE